MEDEVGRAESHRIGVGVAGHEDAVALQSLRHWNSHVQDLAATPVRLNSKALSKAEPSRE